MTEIIVEFLHNQRRTGMVLIGVLLVFFFGIIDYCNGAMVAMTMFYAVPVCIVAWFAGRLPGLVVAFASAAIWYGAKYLDPGMIDRHLLLLWNCVQRFGIFAMTAILTSEVAERKRVEQALRGVHEELELRVADRTRELAQANQALQTEVQERTAAQDRLRQLNETLEERVAERTAAAEQRAIELVRSEAALRHQTSILQSILNSMGDGVIVADAEGKVLLFNPAAQRLIRAGLAASPAGGPNRQEIVRAYPNNEHPLARAIRGEVIDGSEVFLRRSDGAPGIWLTATGRPLLDDQGSVQGGVIVYTDISARKQMEKQVAEISDREQQRIGQDLHDTLCQQMVSTAFAAEVLREKLERQKRPEAAQAETIAEMLNEGITQARRLARGLYPVRLEVDGLTSALEELASMTEARSHVQCRFSCEEAVFIYDQVAANNLFRIAQEAINNAVKHGHCQNISIGLGAVEEEVILSVQDDGVGFPEKLEHNGGMGLHIMNYRAMMIGASLDIRRGMGGGAIVLCSFHNRQAGEKEQVRDELKG